MGEKYTCTIVSMEFFPFITILIVIHSSICPYTVDIGKN